MTYWKTSKLGMVSIKKWVLVRGANGGSLTPVRETGHFNPDSQPKMRLKHPLFYALPSEGAPDPLQKQGYTAKVKTWLDKPEQADLVKSIKATISPNMKSEKQEQAMLTQAKNYIRNQAQLKLSCAGFRIRHTLQFPDRNSFPTHQSTKLSFQGFRTCVFQVPFPLLRPSTAGWIPYEPQIGLLHRAWIPSQCGGEGLD